MIPTRPATSSLAMALADKTRSVDIPKPRDGGIAPGLNSLAALPGQPDSRLGMLPTPPNSISPPLCPQGFRRPVAFPGSPMNPIDSDIDLQEAVDHAKVQDQPPHHHIPLVAEALNSLEHDGSDAITPAILAKHYLPDILLGQGPLAIRYIIGYLATSVPGFSRIPLAKARRLVVAALEGGTANGDSLGSDANVEFEKVGWGRWEARRRNHHGGDQAHISPPSSLPSHPREKIGIPNGERHGKHYTPTMTGESAVFSHSDFDYGDHADVLEHEADKMSLDGDNRSYCLSETPDDEMDGDWGEADLTDEEDWAHIGATALRAQSLSYLSRDSQDCRMFKSHGHSGGPAYSALAKSVPGGIPIQRQNFSLPAGLGGDKEERAAVEALLQLGSM